MRWICFTIFLAILLSSHFANASSWKFAQRAKAFVENKGQITDQFHHPRKDVDFKFNAAAGLNVFIGGGHLHYQWNRKTQSGATDIYRLDIELLGSNRNAKGIPDEQTPIFIRYYLPGLPEKGALSHSYKKVTYPEVYPGIDWAIYLNENGLLEYDFIVRPGGNVSDIKIKYGGSNSLHIDSSGRLIAATPLGQITENAPFAYQAHSKMEVASEFVLDGDILSFNIAPHTGTIVVDPTIEWATYFGGESRDYGMAVAADTSGNVIIVGNSESTENIATTGSFQETYAGGTGELGYPSDAFIAKFDREGELLWSTYVGGTNDESFNGVTTDTEGNILVAGWSRSAEGMATEGSAQFTHGGGDDACVLKFSGDGERLWGSYYGGSGDENGPVAGSIYLDTNEDIYIAGTTTSEDNISSMSASTFNGISDGFLAKFDSGGDLLWGRYLGSDDYTAGYCVSGAGDSVVYVGGLTMSASGIATSGTHQEILGGSIDGFIKRFDSEGNGTAGTYYGGGNVDGITGIVCNEGVVYAIGVTYSDDAIASLDSYQDTLGGNQDILLAQFNHDLTRNWCTYLGGGVSDGTATSATLATDLLGNVYLTGNSSSSENMASDDAFQAEPGGDVDAFIAKFNSEGEFLFGSYYGGSGIDYANGIAASASGMIYVTGQTGSGASIATGGSYQAELAGGDDAFLLMINDCIIPDTPGTMSGPEFTCRGAEYTYSTTETDGATSYSWTIPDGWIGESTDTSITLIAGSVGGTLSVAANGLCATSAARTIEIFVSPKPTLSPATDTNICMGSSIDITAEGIGESTLFQWRKDLETLPGETNSVLSVSEEGLYLVITDNGTCIDTSSSIHVSLSSLPVPVIINTSGLLSTTEPFSSYQWNFEGLPITGAVSATLMTTIPGDYTVTVTDDAGCEGTSGELTDLDDLSKSQQVNIYPNPTQGTVTVRSDFSGRLGIYDALGRLVQEKIMIKEGISSIDLSSLADGQYLLSFQSSDEEQQFRTKLTISH